MKKFALTLSVVGLAFGLAACESTGTGNVETAVPYTTERTASHGSRAAVETKTMDQVQHQKSERVFRQQQSK